MLVIFLLNVVLNVRDLWQSYCYCKKVSTKCSVCQFRMVYLNDDYEIYENSFDLNFLSIFHDPVYKNLKRLLNIDSHVVCQLINRKFYYSHKDWFDGKIKRFYLPYCLDVYVNNKINSIKNNEFKVVLDPLPLKKYFFK